MYILEHGHGSVYEHVINIKMEVEMDMKKGMNMNMDMNMKAYPIAGIRPPQAHGR
jgi:hypothetical protein